jgi:three-Cys-motif partner protein
VLKKPGKKKVWSAPQESELPFPGGLPERPEPDTEPLIKPISHIIWTANKAKLIERYLLYFVFITRHGTYIDGFAGPQQPDHPEMWAAKLVLDSEPKWFRHFHLFDLEPDQIARLESLKSAQQPTDSKGKKVIRDITIYEGDFNQRIYDLLAEGSITPREATFCLLDQRSTECRWKTLQALADYKPAGSNKIELFYFLAVGWLGRTLAATKTPTNLEGLDEWWGRKDWNQFIGMRKQAVADIFVQRIKQDFGYKSVKAWPIYDGESGGNIMYYMIHATDHPEAPKLMSRAYERAVFQENYEQLRFDDFFQTLDS